MEELNIKIRVPPNKPNYKKEFSYLVILNGYLERLQRQEDRIKEQNNKNSLTRKERELLFADIHFFLVVISNLLRLFKKTKKVLSREKEFVDICKKYIKELESLRPFRDNLEHIAEGRIEGFLRRGKRLKDPSMLGHLVNGCYNFGGESFNLEEAFSLRDRINNNFKSWVLRSDYKQISEL